MTISVGIVGCGSITEFRHAPEYAANQHVNEIVFYDRNPERAQRLANKFGGRVVSNMNDLVSDSTIAAISDCSSNENHHIVTTEALQNGKHVLCEKPIANTLEDAHEMVEAAKSTNKILMIAHNQRFMKAHQKARDIIKSGKLGNVLTFKTNFGHKGPEHWGINKSNSTWFFKKNRSFLGVAGDLGIHKVDLLRYILDDEMTEISAFQGALHKKDENGDPIDVCDNMVGMFKTAKGAMGTAAFSWTYYGNSDNSTIIHLEKGTIKLYSSPTNQIEVINQNGDITNYDIDSSQTNSGVIDHFVESILQNKQPLVSGVDGLASLNVILAMVKSAETGMVVNLTAEQETL